MDSQVEGRKYSRAFRVEDRPRPGSWGQVGEGGHRGQPGGQSMPITKSNRREIISVNSHQSQGLSEDYRDEIQGNDGYSLRTKIFKY